VKPLPPHAWPAMTPSPEFADRVVAAALRERLDVQNSRGERRRRRLLLGAPVVATVLVAAGVWARTAGPEMLPQDAPPSIDAAKDIAPRVRRPGPALGSPPFGSEPTRPASAATSPLPRAPRKAELPPAPTASVAAPPAASEVELAPVPIAPSCPCTDWDCDCVEVPWMAKPHGRPAEKGSLPCEGIDWSGGCVPLQSSH
jgi:hypothetical protein